MKLFGNFLVERNEITAGDLVDALIIQLKSLPTVAEVVHRLKLMSPDDQLKVLTYQSQYRCEYIVACRKFGLWGDQIEAAVMRELATHRKPIGQILVDASKIDSEKLTALLDEFIAEIPREEKLRRQNVAEAQAKLEMSVMQIGQSDSRLQGFEPSFSRVSPSDPVLREFFEIFDSRFMSRVRELVEGIGSEDGQSQLKLVALQGDIVTAAASARFVRLPLLSKLFGSVEEWISGARADSLNSIRKSELMLALDVAWEIRRLVSLEESEESYWTNQQTKDRYVTAVSQLMAAGSQISVQQNAA